MKFAHDFEDTLRREDFPPRWVDFAIPYGQLKKCLKRVQRELRDLGLDPVTLRQLLDPTTDSPLALKYRLNSTDSKTLRPNLTVLIHVQDGIAVDASLSPSSRSFLERIAALQSTDQHRVPPSETPTSSSLGQAAEGADEPSGPPLAPNPRDEATDVSSGVAQLDPAYESIEVPLVFDGKFFDMLQSDVNRLDILQSEEERTMTSEIVSLGQEVSQLVKPTRLSKSDLTRWRSIFELYLEAQVFFSTHEHDHGARDSQTAIKLLQWFQDEVQKRNLARDFKLAESRQALIRFLHLNAILLKNLQFQEINQLAVVKILKKFDKQTSLGVAKSFPVAVQSDKLLAGSMAKDMCAQISTELLSVVPQLDDYLCPVCFSLAYMPIRLACRHVFCIRCIVKIQRRKEKHCPLCRAKVISSATADNMDFKLEKYLRKYFPKEAKEKQRANEIERGIEVFGPAYTQSECCTM